VELRTGMPVYRPSSNGRRSKHRRQRDGAQSPTALPRAEWDLSEGRL